MNSENVVYQVRECRSHFHVTCGGDDVIILGDPFPTREAAERMAHLLNSDLTCEQAEELWAKE